MKFKKLKLFLLSALAFQLSASSASAAGLTIDNFESSKTGAFPSSWRTWPFQRGKASIVYKVAGENGDNFLSADDDKGLSIQIFRNFPWDADKYPVLNWRWRARVLPELANETSPATNDSACGVYVIYSRNRSEALKYTWSTLAPAGTIYEKKRGKIYIIAKQSGDSNKTKWQTEKVDVRDEYQKHFGRPLMYNPAGIAILTDGNATRSPAACDYDDFVVTNE